ncbi:DUF559 domain-containing protein [Micromonospora sp. NPDC049559]|uniref:DUF559 domain-containing protein n=1 Tax=Micromonospora sp. NPDC049559 TaxID=3155923 RepID=UPI0034340969
MNPLLRSLVDQGGGLVTRAEAGQALPVWILERAVRTGHLRRMLPGVYLDARLEPTSRLLRRAALHYGRGRGALSHTTALDVWGVRSHLPGEAVHLTVPAGSGLRSRPGLTIHQQRDFTAEPPQVVVRRGLSVTRIERALVDAWPLLPSADAPGPVIRAVNDRLTTPARIVAAMARAPKLTGRVRLRVLLDRLAAGCHSALEIWGHDHVFSGSGMPSFQRQVRMRVAGRTVYLDVYAEHERVDFELDGAATHGDLRQREIDLRRDAALAALGILVVRFTHRRLVRETAAVRQEVLAILAARRTRAPADRPSR